eukprot:3812625-Pyramimonas_sp.AAC.1
MPYLGNMRNWRYFGAWLPREVIGYIYVACAARGFLPDLVSPIYYLHGLFMISGIQRNSQPLAAFNQHVYMARCSHKFVDTCMQECLRSMGYP